MIERKIEDYKLDLGSKAPYFSLKATDGKIYSLADFEDSTALVVLFTANHCPYSNAADVKVCDLIRKHSSKNIKFVMICSNNAENYPQDSFELMRERSEQQGFLCPYLQDDSQIVAKAYDAACTPEAYVFDSEQKLKYHGCIEAHLNPESEILRPDLALAIEDVAHGENPEVSLTPAYGCSIKWKVSASNA